ncbi:MAG: ABC transporter permease [Methylobacterium sp.]|jgi:ABC-type spermidine/putrescine transport system permease subunit I|nr:ABC transporter permease [Methylobacterium sp.]MCA3602329.1 ABC transporter permease [Methylobacterium sp.]MCA3613953.1 ABC transporter permease [Methylobacterium sp.]MCA3619453.1 ABC transporter permease [Methylobacterium sp.]MCA3622386.1 ABC transporter permease [Methylobacterium sp.]
MSKAAGPNAEGLRRDALVERLALFSLSGPALLLVTMTMLLPVGWLFWLSFLDDAGALTLEHYRRMLVQPSYGRAFRITFEISFITTAICILLGYPLAYVLSQLPRRAANICMIAVMLPFWTSLLVRTYAWLVLLQRQGVINTWGMKLGLWDTPLTLVHNLNGTLIGMVHIMLPFMVLPVYASMRAIDQDYLRAAANLGASPTWAFWLVFLPLSLPGLLAGALMVFILCLGFYVTPAVLGGGKITMVANRIATDIELFFNWGAASSLGVVLFVLTGAILYVASRVVRLDRLLGGGAA